jgi:hypothetical protein
MAYLLSDDGRDDDVVGAFKRYRDYLSQSRPRFPKSAYALAASDWWFDPRDHRSPHDGWLEGFQLTEHRAAAGASSTRMDLSVTLLAAYHDGYIRLLYSQVSCYRLTCSGGQSGHRDWRYDELRVSDEGRLIHEIEWWGPTENARWIIEASDLEYEWLPLGRARP